MFTFLCADEYCIPHRDTPGVHVNHEELLRVAIIDDAHKTDTPQGRAIQRIIAGLKEVSLLAK